MVLLGFHSPFSLIFLNPEGHGGWRCTRKGIKFWIERLIINSARELSFRETCFHYLVNNIE